MAQGVLHFQARRCSVVLPRGQYGAPVFKYLRVNLMKTFKACIIMAILPSAFVAQLHPARLRDVGDCQRLTEDSNIFGNRSLFSNRGLLATTLTANETSPTSVRIVRTRLLSEATGTKRNTASSVSFLVEYQLPGENNTHLAQVAMDCILDPFNPAMNYSFFPSPNPTNSHFTTLNTARVAVGSVLRTINITANFSTEPEFNCGQTGYLEGPGSNTVTLCICKFVLGKYSM